MIGIKLLEMSARQKAAAREPGSVACPKCEKASRPLRPRTLNITTLCGVIRVERWMYCCEEKHYHMPWDKTQKLRGKYTHRVAEAICHLSARFDLEKRLRSCHIKE